MRARFLAATVMPVILLIGAAEAGASAELPAGKLPAVGVDAQPLSLPDGAVAYMTKSERAGTVLTERTRLGRTLRERRLSGVFSIPAVAYDGSAGGLSGDGRTLVLISPRRAFPARTTTFAVVDTRRLAVRRHVELAGDFSFDAISPDGNTIYLIAYSGSLDKYAVRAYDLPAGRLLPRPVVDPDEADEPMTGAPISRAPSPDGRWAYTLYQSEEHPFVHALDTARRTAVCIDLDDLSDVSGATLNLRGTRLEVTGGSGDVLATIDTTTHRVVGVHRPEGRTTGDSTNWLPLALPTAGLLLLLVGASVLRRKPSADGPSGPARRSTPY
jgi:hypothetical protein